VKEQYAQSLVDRAFLCRITGDLPKAVQCLATAETILQRIRVSSSLLHIRIMLESCLLRERLVTNSAYWQPERQRREALIDVLERARAVGSLQHSVSGAVALTGHYLYASHDLQALESARLALALAKQHPSEHVFTQTLLWLAYGFMSSRCWESMERLIYAIEPLEPLDAELRAVLHCIDAGAALRAGQYERAWALSSPIADGGAPTVDTKKRLIAAAAADALERRYDALDLLEAAVSGAEKLGSAALLREAYGIAAHIGGGAHYVQKAQELTRLFTT
jgi:hypothetical protein